MTADRTASTDQTMLLVVGSLNYDLVLRHDRLPRAGETVTGAVFTESCGGKGANQAVAAARFIAGRAGAPRIVFAGAVGDDLFGRRQLEQLRADGVDTTNVLTLEGVSTGTSTIWVDSTDGQNRILNAPGANDAYGPEGLDDLPIAGASWLLLQNEIPPSTTAAVARRAASCGVPVIWDPAPFAPGAEIPLDPSHVAIVTPNETEAESLLCRPLSDDPSADARALCALGFATAVLTMGSAGVVVAQGDGRTYSVAAPEVQAVDTTAAGDAFSGALAASLAIGMDLREAVSAGVLYASRSVLLTGAQTSFPTGHP